MLLNKSKTHIQMKTVFSTNAIGIINIVLLLLNVFAKHVLEYNKLSKIFCVMLGNIHCEMVVSFEKTKLELLQV